MAKFSSFKDREKIRTSSSSITDRKYSVREQFPMEIEQKRKLLYPVMKIAKNDPTVRDVKLVRDKLYIDGKQYHPRLANDNPPNRRPPTYNFINRPFNRNIPPPTGIPGSYRQTQNNNMSQYNSGACGNNGDILATTPRRSFVHETCFRSMRDGDRMETDTIFPTNDRKKKATSPLTEQQSPKKHKESRTFEPINETPNVDNLSTVNASPMRVESDVQTGTGTTSGEPNSSDNRSVTLEKTASQ
ncbi:MAG: hypothetical protein ABW185_24200 [Sedimenticola sp.]